MTKIESPANENIKRAARLLRDAAERNAAGLAVCEGAKLAHEAYEKKLTIEQLYCTQVALTEYKALLAGPLTAARETFLISDAAAERLSQQRAPQGVTAVVRRPALCDIAELFGLGRVLMLCSVQDPANVGAAMRSAAAFGFFGVVLAGECADAFSPKVLRAAMGAAFSLKLCREADELSAIRAFNDAGFTTAAAYLSDSARPVSEYKNERKLLAVIGNEGRGLSEAAADLCRGRLIIPMHPGVESLNAAVAAGVIMWELGKREDEGDG